MTTAFAPMAPNAVQNQVGPLFESTLQKLHADWDFA